MKLCFPSQQSEGTDGVPHGHFGAAHFFVIHDTDAGTTEIVDTSKGKAQHAHGQCSPVGALAGHDVDALVVGGIGTRALMILNQQGIRVYRAQAGTIQDNIDAANRGELVEMDPAGACAGHSH